MEPKVALTHPHASNYRRTADRCRWFALPKVLRRPLPDRHRLGGPAGIAKIRVMKHAWNRSIRAALQTALTLLLAACAGAPTQKKPAAAAPSPTVTKSTDADEQAATALNVWGNDPDNASKALALAQKAGQSAPQRADVVWLYLRLCASTPGCEAEAIEAHLRTLDPNNGAVWLEPLARAQARRDTQAAAQILDVMSKASHFNVYWTTLIARLTPPISRTSTATSVAQPMPTPLTNSLNATIGWMSRLDTPAFASLSAACDETQVRDPATRARCDLISQALQKSDTTLAEGLGLGIAQRLATPGSTTELQLTEKINTLRYQHQTAGSIVAAQVEKDKFSEQMLKLMAQLPREQDVSRAILKWAGRPLSE